MERREPVARPSSTFPLLAVVDSCGARGIWAVWVVFIEFPSAAVTIGPVEEGWRLLQWVLSAVVRYWSEAPESGMMDGGGFGAILDTMEA